MHAIVALEPAGPPFREPVSNGGGPARKWGVADIPLTYTPSGDFKFKTLPPLANITASEPCTLQDESKGEVKKLVNLKGMKVVVVTAEASWHVGYDWCTVAFLRQAGVDTELLDLKEKGVRGNGHMFFLEKNSDESAAVVREWIKAIGGG